jgi:ADP-ribose pyrophosphatase
MSQQPPLLITERFRVEEVTRTLPDGRSRTRAVVRHPGAVAIIPMVDANHVCLIANYRVSIGQTLLEIPAGTLEPNESPYATAARELLEETGYRVAQLEPLTSFFLSPGVLDERMHLFVAQQLTLGETARELGEEIENRVTPWEEAIAMIYEGRIHDAKTIAGLLYYDRLRHAAGRCTGK